VKSCSHCEVMQTLCNKVLNCRCGECVTPRVGQNRIYTPYMAVYLVISLPKIPYINRIFMVLANPSYALYERAV